MNNNLTEIIFILDRSGSMSGLEADTIGGFNSLIEKQKKEEGEALVSTVLFSDDSEVIYDRVDINKVEPMNDKQYYVRGCTALLDAVGGAIEHMQKVRKYAREEERAGKVLFIITTDGMENASHRYSHEKVKRMIKDVQTEMGWEFVFLGANIDSVSVAGGMGISPSRAVNYNCDEAGTSINFGALSKLVSSARQCRTSVEMNMMMEAPRAGWREDIDADYAKRKKKR